MNREDVNRLIEEAKNLHHEAQSKRADYEKAAGDDGISAEQATEIDRMVDAALEAKSKADGAIETLEREQKWGSAETAMGALNAWQERSRGVLPGMAGGDGGAEKADGERRERKASPGIEYKDARGEVKEYRPRGVGPQFGAEEEVRYAEVFRKYLVRGVKGLTHAELDLAERKGLSVGSDISGGFLVASEVMAAQLIESLEDAVLMRRIGTVLPALRNAQSIKFGTASDLDDAEWTSELATGSNDTSTPFGARALHPHPLAKRVKVSNTLLRLADMNTEAWVRGEGVNKIASAEESAFMTGSGANRPEGVFTSSLATTVTAASATDIAYDDLVDMEGSIKAQYRAAASWIMHRTIIKEIYKLKDGNGRPLLRDMPNAGVRFDLLGYPLYESEYAPSSSATGLDVAALGDWKRAYYIVDTLNTQIQVLTELYAETNETGYIFRQETDGMVINGDSVAVLTMA